VAKRKQGDTFTGLRVPSGCPKQVSISGIQVAIKYFNEESEGVLIDEPKDEGLFGFYRSFPCPLIGLNVDSIDDSLPDPMDSLKSTAIHEIIEAINDMNQNGLSEKDVRNLEVGLYSALRANRGALAKWIAKGV